MDRFQWLECQPWLLPSGLQSSEVIEWVFHGFASFYVPLTKWGHSHYTEGEEEKGQEAAEEDHLSETASHLRFAAQSSLLHPDQMVFKLGVAPDESGGNRSTCQFLPSCLITRLKHLHMIMYSKEPHFNDVMDMLIKALKTENAPPLNHESREREAATCIAEHSPGASVLASASEALLQEFLVKLDCISEWTSKAVDVCFADALWMSSLLNAMVKEVANGKNISLQIKAIQHQLKFRLQALEEDEHKHIATVWGAKATKNLETRVTAVEGLRVTLEQKEQIQAAILRIELLNASMER